MTEPRSLEEWVEKLERELADARRALDMLFEEWSCSDDCPVRGINSTEEMVFVHKQAELARDAARSSAQAAQPEGE